MLQGPKLRPPQWRRLASVFSNVGQAIVIFSLAAVFVPEVVGLKLGFPRLVGFLYLFWGLIIIMGAVILSYKEE